MATNSVLVCCCACLRPYTLRDNSLGVDGILCWWLRRLQAAHMPTRVPEVVELATKWAIRPAGSSGLRHFRQNICPALLQCCFKAR
jgi:hypothetical protein